MGQFSNPQSMLIGKGLTLFWPSRKGAANLGLGFAAMMASANGVPGDILSLRLDVAKPDTKEQGSDGIDEQTVRLYDSLRPSLYRYLLNVGLASQDVEEIVQETFLRLYRHLHNHGVDENLRAWIYQVAHNLSADFRKSRRKLVETTPELWGELSDSRPDNSPGPEDQVLRRERVMRVHRALSDLTKLQRDCVNLRVEGFRYREIAGILGVATSTVSGSLRNAITRLAKEYS
jgi:RNA polymerase sigma-70 factor (ECF subfamily)